MQNKSRTKLCQHSSSQRFPTLHHH